MLLKSGQPRDIPVDSEKPERSRKREDRPLGKPCDPDKALDHTLEQTFPASDPLSTIPAPCEDEDSESEAA